MTRIRLQSSRCIERERERERERESCVLLDCATATGLDFGAPSTPCVVNKPEKGGEAVVERSSTDDDAGAPAD